MKTSKWDMAEFLNSKEDIIAHLTVAFEENDMEALAAHNKLSLNQLVMFLG